MSLEKLSTKNIEKYLHEFYTKNFEQEYLDYDLDYPIKKTSINTQLISELPKLSSTRNLKNILIKVTFT